MANEKDAYVGRVDQIDAIDFDAEIVDQLTSQQLAAAAARYLSPDHWFHIFFPEIRLVLRSGFYATSLFRQNSTLGQNIQGLRFQDGATSTMYKLLAQVSQHMKYLVFVIMSVLPEYLKDRHLLPSTPKLKFILGALRLTNLVVFLQEGLFPTVEARVLHLKASKIKDASGYYHSYDILSRELLWHSFLDLAKDLTPVINWRKLTEKLKYLSEDVLHMGKSERLQTHYKAGDCGICKNPVVNASIAGSCSHAFCYYCLGAELKTGTQLPCPLCGKDLNFEEIQATSI